MSSFHLQMTDLHSPNKKIWLVVLPQQTLIKVSQSHQVLINVAQEEQVSIKTRSVRASLSSQPGLSELF